MTTQWPDSCTFDGRKWAIEHWNGPTGCVPTNEQLGFRTVSPSTANWSGRIDHFLVHRGQLYLFKVEVTLAPEDKGVLPFGSRREIVLCYEQLEVHDNRGMRMEERERRYEYLVFDDLIIPFTGSLHLRYPFFDHWEVPWPIDDEDEQTTEEVILDFEDGWLR
jgi:hypothetical protein